MTPIRAAAAAFAALSLAACNNVGIIDTFQEGAVVVAFATPGRTLETDLGRELRLTIRTVGPGEYASPPELQGSSLVFLDVRLASEQVPAGVTQEFRFATAARGTTVLRFHNTVSSTVVSDTVMVR